MSVSALRVHASSSTKFFRRLSARLSERLNDDSARDDMQDSRRITSPSLVPAVLVSRLSRQLNTCANLKNFRMIWQEAELLSPVHATRFFH